MKHGGSIISPQNPNRSKQRKHSGSPPLKTVPSAGQVMASFLSVCVWAGGRGERGMLILCFTS